MREIDRIAGGGCSSAGDTRRVSLLAIVFAIVLGTAACSAKDPESGQPMAGKETRIKVDLVDFAIQPSTIDVPAGNRVAFDVDNSGKTPHNFELRQGAKTIGGTKDLDPGERETYTTMLQSGTYEAYCSEPGHESLGMRIQVKVA